MKKPRRITLEEHSRRAGHQGKGILTEEERHSVSGYIPRSVSETMIEKRWRVTIVYLDSSFDTHFIEELEELQEIIERGPNFGLILEIKIILNYKIPIGGTAP